MPIVRLILINLLMVVWAFSAELDTKKIKNDGVNHCSFDFFDAGYRTKVYNDSIVKKLKGSCSGWENGKKSCRFGSEEDESTVDSVIYKNGEYYELFEKIFVDGSLVYEYYFLQGNDFIEKKYDQGRLFFWEVGCVIDNPIYGKNCEGFADSHHLKVDSSGHYVSFREEYVWDNQGRLKQRKYWTADDVFGMNGTYTIIYGSPCDTIRVTPVDFPTDYLKRNNLEDWDVQGLLGLSYDASFGMIPEKDDPEYVKYARDPYPRVGGSSKDLQERQKKRCEDYKKSLKKGNGKTR